MDVLQVPQRDTRPAQVVPPAQGYKIVLLFAKQLYRCCTHPVQPVPIVWRLCFEPVRNYFQTKNIALIVGDLSPVVLLPSQARFLYAVQSN